VDIFSAGCVLAETFSRKPLLPGIDDEDQLELFFKRFGEIELEDGLGSLEENYSEIAKSISSSSRFLSRRENTGDLELYLGDSVPVIMRDLVRTLCNFNPKKRLSAAEVLKHTSFSDLKEPNHSIFTPC
jgi:negative regulator of PHO system